MSEHEELLDAILEEGKEVSLTITITDCKQARCLLRSLLKKENTQLGFQVNSIGFINEVKFYKEKFEKLKELTKNYDLAVSSILKN